ncbi:hypothetical protein [Floridanema evergladense]|uniref:Uncharacterized protein n=1 Tax=Floridaenema evergladense BLCC-F167 TaxID=3153639 RepID=A0ABV4WF93_9CYAN
MKPRGVNLAIFRSVMLSLWYKTLVGCQPLLSDRHQIDIIRLTLWQEANLTALISV